LPEPSRSPGPACRDIERRVSNAIAALLRAQEAVSFMGVARRSGLSASLLYSTRPLAAQIADARQRQLLERVGEGRRLVTATAADRHVDALPDTDVAAPPAFDDIGAKLAARRHIHDELYVPTSGSQPAKVPTVTGTQRHLPGGWRRPRDGKQQRRFIASVVAIVCIVAVLAVLLITSALTSSGRGWAGRLTGSGRGGPAAVAAVAASRAQAARWIAAQASRAAIVACDPVMCSAIQARGFPAGNLGLIGPSSHHPLGSEIVVATAAIRGQFGSRLSQVYAPLIIASFGSGAARIDIRVTAVGRAAAYLGALRADVTSRQQTGSQLLHNSRLAVAAPARQELAAGQVDSRMLATLAVLTATANVEVRAFGDHGPGASPGVPLRLAELAVIGTGASGRAYLQWLLAFLNQQRAPYKAASIRMLRVAGSTVVDVEFSAPSPLGLLVNSP
jgi:hypothetical protein